MPTSEQVEQAARRYATAVSSADREAIVARFAPDAEVVDPYPAEAVRGHDGIRGFWDNVLAMGVPQTFEIEHISVAGDAAAFVFHLLVAVGGEALFQVRGVDVVRVDDEGLLTSLTAYWTPTALSPVEAASEEGGSDTASGR